MKFQGRNLTLRMNGADVGLLQSELVLLGSAIPRTETDERSFGPATRKAVLDFQSQQRLTISGEVDERTANLINQTLEALRPSVVTGHVRGQDGTPFHDLPVEAFDKDLRSEERLGHTRTDERGYYVIRYTAEQFRRADKRTADLIVRVLGKEGAPLVESDILFNAPATTTIDLTITPINAKQLSEYEELFAYLTPILEGVKPADLTEDDLKFLLGETGVNGPHAALLRQAAQLSRETGLPTEAFYGWGRLTFPLNLEQLFANPPEILRKALETAIAQNIAPANLHDSLDDIAGRFADLQLQKMARSREDLVTHEVVAQLLDQVTGAPLSGFSVHVFDLDAPAQPQDRGRDITNGKGLFALAYITRRSTLSEEGAADGVPRQLQLQISDPQGKEIFRTDVRVTASQEQVLAVRVPVPPPLEGPTHLLTEVAAKSKLELPPELLPALAQQGIHTLADIRKVGGIAHLENLPVAADHPALAMLEAHANLVTLSSDLELNATLIENGYPSLAAIAGAPRADVVTLAHGALGDPRAALMQRKAIAQSMFINNVMTEHMVAVANGFARDKLDPSFDKTILGDLLTTKCGCKGCEAAVSPLAYLADLLEYALKHVRNGEALITLQFLTDTFHQPVRDLPASCETMDTQVRQVRICIEVLRSRLNGVSGPLTATEHLAFSNAVKAYLIATYTMLLNSIGISYDKIRLARTDQPVTRRALADALGIDLDLAETDQLDALFLDPSASAEHALTEEALEKLLGLVTTTRDPLSDGAIFGDPQTQLSRWNFEGVEWLRNTDRDGMLYLTLVGHKQTVHPLIIVDRLEVYRDRERTKLVAFGEQTVNTSNAAVTITLAEANGSRLSGSVNMNHFADNSEIEIAALPNLLGWRLAHLRTLWREQDWPDDPYSEGQHIEVSVRLPAGMQFPGPLQEKIRYVAARQLLSFTGVMKDEERDLLLSLSPARLYQEATKRLYLRSQRPAIIDPDLIGPDDFRTPVAKANPGDPDTAFDLWIKRREWVDARTEALSELKRDAQPPHLPSKVPDLEAIFSSMYQSVTYGTRTFVPWATTTPPAKFAPLFEQLSTPVDAEAASLIIQTDLGLTVESFSRLMAISAKDQEANRDPRSEPVTDDGWRELSSILAQAQKVKVGSVWREEEQALAAQTGGVLIGPRLFWLSLREPVEGDWPPVLNSHRPLIDPELLKIEELPEPAAGKRAIAFWQARRTRLAQINRDLKAEREQRGFEAMLTLALGPPQPGHTWQQDLTALKNDLTSSDAVVAESAETRIATDLHMTPDAFNRLVVIGAKSDDRTQAQKPTEAEYAEGYAILTSAQKERQEYSNWIGEENASGVIYWSALKAKLPRWRATVEAWQGWRQALRIRGGPPLIDPDLIGPGDLEDPFAGDAAIIWQERSAWIQELTLAKQRVRATTPLAGFDGILVASLFEAGAIATQRANLTSARNAIGIDGVLAQALGTSLRELSTLNQQLVSSVDPIPKRSRITRELYLSVEDLAQLVKVRPNGFVSQADLDAFDTILTKAVTVASVMSLDDDQRRNGIDVTARLEQFSLTSDAFSYLLRVRDLVASDAPVLDSEWADVYAILTQVLKRRAFAEWREQERSKNLTLGPDFFKIPAVDTTVFPPPSPPELPAWRGTRVARQDWQDTLQSRIDQERATIAALREGVGATEEVTLPMLRDALIMAAHVEGVDLKAKAKWITDHLLIDAANGGCQKTTRVAQAIETIQGLLFSLRTNQLHDTYPNLELDAEDFDEEWGWIGSYATWRAASFVFLYPENILIPSLRKWQTPAFRNLVSSLRGSSGPTLEQACEAASTYSDYFFDVCHLSVEASCHARTRMHSSGSCRARSATDYRYLFYQFARGASSKVYWSAHDAQDGSGYAQTFWEEVPELTNVIDIVGAAPYQVASDQRFIYLFVRIRSVAEELVFTRYDLEQQTWGPPTELKPPRNATKCTAVVKQTISEDAPPHLAIRTTDDRAIYERKLNPEGTDWADVPKKDGNAKPADKKNGESATGDEWMPIVGPLLSDNFAEICAMVQISQNEKGEDEYYLVVRNDHRGTLQYRLFGIRDDGQWRDLSYGSFRGAFWWPGTSDMFAFSADAVSSVYQVIKRSGNNLQSKQPLFDLGGLNDWLTRVAGIRIDTIFPWNAYDHEDSDPGKKLEDDSAEGRMWKLADTLIRKFTVNPTQGLGTVLWFANHRSRAGSGRSVPYIGDPNFVFRDDAGEVSPAAGVSDGILIRDLHDPISFLASLSGMPAVPGLYQIAPRSEGAIGESVAVPQFAYQRTDGQSCRCTFSRSDDTLTENARTRVAPQLNGPFSYAPRLRGDKLQMIRQLIQLAFEANSDGPSSNLSYLEEAYYFVPVHLALQLQARGQFTAALDWFRLVYDYNMPIEERKIYYGLEQEAQLSFAYKRADGWLLDPLNPHTIAATRANTYTRFTLISLIRCFLDFADAEFTRDTPESVARARTLYMTALELLDTDELRQHLGLCADLIGSLDIEVGEAEWRPVWHEIAKRLEGIRDMTTLRGLTAKVKTVMAGEETLAARLAGARTLIAETQAKAPGPRKLGAVIEANSRIADKVQTALLAQPSVAAAANSIGSVVETDYLHAVSLISGVTTAALAQERVELPWLRERMTISAGGTGPLLETISTRPAMRQDYLALTRFNPITPTHLATLARIAEAAPLQATKIATKVGGWYAPAPSYHFCIPPNPDLEALRLRAELNLYKLRNCRNNAGIERQLDPYAAPTDTVSGLPKIGVGGQIVLPGLAVLKPTPYRYSVLIDRAKQLVQYAAQIEAAMLSALEKRDAEEYNQLKARNDVQLARAGVRLQDLRRTEAENGVKVAELQRNRAQIQAEHYKALIAAGISELEQNQIDLLLDAVNLAMLAAGLAAIPTGEIVGTASGIFKDFAGPTKEFAQAVSTQASIAGLQASFERHQEDWQFQQALAQQDIALGEQQMTSAEDHVRVVGQELAIAQRQVDNTEVLAEFLAAKFTNAELYDWMSGALEQIYSRFLQQATAMAKLGENQLAFERQETPPPFIQADYWDSPTDGGGLDGRAPDRRGLTGSARLLQDIAQLDQYAFETNQRKLQLTTTISLAKLDPFAFQRFRATGVLLFATPMEMFDREFPGHYLRLIKRVRASVIALIPPTQGVRATLSTTGTSRVVIGGDTFQTVVRNIGAQSIAFSTPLNASGLFEIDPQPDMLLPFEGIGVDAHWEFRMPRAANLFDYSSIADVLITIDYTALNSYDYYQQVIQTLRSTLSADRPFSFRQEFADQWYDLHNPDQTATPMVVRFSIGRDDFPANLDNLRIQQVLLYFARADGESFEVPVTELRFTEQGGGGTAGGGATSIDGAISTRRANAGSWAAMIGKAPFGAWELALPDAEEVRNRFKNDEIDDVLFVITYSGRTPDWPA